MKIITYLCLIACQFSWSQLKVSSVNYAQQLVDNLLGDAKNIRISNPKITSEKEAFGLFTTKLNYINFLDAGIIISTGLATSAIGPNKQQNKTSHINFFSDSDINDIAAHKGCYDTSLFEFDLVSETDQIQFNYVFASEEYPEYINKNVNDVFIFLVTNTQSKVSENIAILNGDKNTPITVDHINQKKNTNFYLPNNQFTPELLKSKHMKAIEMAYTFQYDGFTTKLTAIANVEPYVKYHFKLGISDVGDQNFDSAIFLEANSLKSTGTKPSLSQAISSFKDELSLDFDIGFEYNSAKLKGENSYKLLNQIIDELKKDQSISVQIIGHTDQQGTETHNLDLSLKRAQTVTNYLINQNISKHRITTDGLGETQLKSHLDEENRRVEIIFKR